MSIRNVEIEGAVDFDDFGNPIALEVLDWRRQLLNGHVKPSLSSDPVRWSYDDEIDALHIHLAVGRGQI